MITSTHVLYPNGLTYTYFIDFLLRWLPFPILRNVGFSIYLYMILREGSSNIHDSAYQLMPKIDPGKMLMHSTGNICQRYGW